MSKEKIHDEVNIPEESQGVDGGVNFLQQQEGEGNVPAEHPGSSNVDAEPEKVDLDQLVTEISRTIDKGEANIPTTEQDASGTSVFEYKNATGRGHVVEIGPSGIERMEIFDGLSLAEQGQVAESVYDMGVVAEVARNEEVPQEAKSRARQVMLANEFFANTVIAENQRQASGPRNPFMRLFEGKRRAVKGVLTALAAFAAMGSASAAFAGERNKPSVLDRVVAQIETGVERGAVRGGQRAGRQAGGVIDRTIEGAAGVILGPMDQARREAGLLTPQEIRQHQNAERRARQMMEREMQKQQRMEERAVRQEMRDPGAQALVEARENRQALELGQLDEEWGEKIRSVSPEEQTDLTIQWYRAREDMLRKHQQEDRRR